MTILVELPGNILIDDVYRLITIYARIEIIYQSQIGAKCKPLKRSVPTETNEVITLDMFNQEQQEEIDKDSVFEISAVAVIQAEMDDDSDENMSSEELLYLPPLSSKETAKDVKISQDLDEEQTTKIKRILGNYRDVLTDIPGKTNIGEHSIKLTDDEPIRQKPYPIPHAVRDEVRKEIDTMLEMGIIRQSSSPYACPLTVVAKPDGSTRICCDTRLLNAKTVFDAEPISDQEEIFAQISKDNFFSKIDLSKGFWQVPMSEESKKYL